jgi:hypothetical protein
VSLPVVGFVLRLFTEIAFDADNNAYFGMKNGGATGVMAVLTLAPGAAQWTQLNIDGLPVGGHQCPSMDMDALGRLVMACDMGVFRIVK